MSVGCCGLRRIIRLGSVSLEELELLHCIQAVNKSKYQKKYNHLLLVKQPAYTGTSDLENASRGRQGQHEQLRRAASRSVVHLGEHCLCLEAPQRFLLSKHTRLRK